MGGSNGSATGLPDNQVYCDLRDRPLSGKVMNGCNNVVTLRRLRDVIFYIQLGGSATYTLSTDHKDEYFLEVGKKRSVKTKTFRDGQKLHIQIGRNFIGDLVVKKGDHVIGRYNVADLDRIAGIQKVSQDPKEQPAPIMIRVGGNNNFPHGSSNPTSNFFPDSSSQEGSTYGYGISTAPPQPTMDFSQEGLLKREEAEKKYYAAILGINLNDKTKVSLHQEMQIVEVQKTNIPKELLDAVLNAAAAGNRPETAFFFDKNHISTYNWVIEQSVGELGILKDNYAWMKEIWGKKLVLSKIMHKNAGEKWYVSFKGDPKLRDFFKAARYGVKNAKVLTMVGGYGSAETRAAAVWASTKGGFKGAGLFTAVFSVSVDVAVWMHDYREMSPNGKRKQDIVDLIATVGIDLVKIGISSAGAELVGSLLIWTVTAFGVAISGTWIVVGVFILAIGVAYLVDLADKKLDAKKHVAEWMRSFGKELKDLAETLGEQEATYGSYAGMFTY